MGEMILLVLVAWFVSALGKAAKRKSQQADDPRRPPATQDEEAPKRRQPARPVDVDLPRQATMPIHWEGTENSPAMEGESYEPYTPHSFIAWGEDPFSEAGQASSRMDKHDAAAAKTFAAERQASVISGLDIELDGDALVKGVVFSEILNRKTARRPR